MPEGRHDFDSRPYQLCYLDSPEDVLGSYKWSYVDDSFGHTIRCQTSDPYLSQGVQVASPSDPLSQSPSDAWLLEVETAEYLEPLCGYLATNFWDRLPGEETTYQIVGRFPSIPLGAPFWESPKARGSPYKKHHGILWSILGPPTYRSLHMAPVIQIGSRVGLSFFQGPSYRIGQHLFKVAMTPACLDEPHMQRVSEGGRVCTWRLGGLSKPA